MTRTLGREQRDGAKFHEKWRMARDEKLNGNWNDENALTTKAGRLNQPGLFLEKLGKFSGNRKLLD